MPVSETNSYNPSIDTIIKDAMVMTGLMNAQQSLSDHQQAHKASFCRRRMADIVDELLAAGVILRWVKQRTFLSVDGQQRYVLGPDVQDVLGSLMFRPQESSSETQISKVRDYDWQRLTNKTSRGVPVQAFIYRGAHPLEAWLWPIPTEDDAVVTYLAHVKAADVDDGSLMLDMPHYWRNYITQRVASDFCFSQSKEQSAIMFRRLADSQFDRLRNKSGSRASVQAVVGHRTGWRRRR